MDRMWLTLLIPSGFASHLPVSCRLGLLGRVELKLWVQLGQTFKSAPSVWFLGAGWNGVACTSGLPRAKLSDSQVYMRPPLLCIDSSTLCMNASVISLTTLYWNNLSSLWNHDILENSLSHQVFPSIYQSFRHMRCVYLICIKGKHTEQNHTKQL